MTRIVVIGAGGHGRVVADTIRAAGDEVVGLLDSNHDLHGTDVEGFRVLGDDDTLSELVPSEIALAVGVGSVGPVRLRKTIFERYTRAGWTIPPVIHPTAWISPGAIVEAGAHVLAGAIVQIGARILVNAIVNTGATVDHDCVVGRHAHLAPGVTLSGSVRVGDGTHVGTGASVIQGVELGSGCMVAAGAVVTTSYGDGVQLFGVPARPRQ